jgi:hypothetical protein
MPSLKTNRKRSKSSSKNTFKRATYAHPKVLMLPPSSSSRRKTDDYDQFKTTDA